jgi:sodium/bile acid cotransporter 3/5
MSIYHHATGKICPASFILILSTFYLISKITFAFTQFLHLDPLEALALFLYGCSPGGSASNNWTILLDGDIDLSAIMTFASTITSLGKQ